MLWIFYIWKFHKSFIKICRVVYFLNFYFIFYMVWRMICPCELQDSLVSSKTGGPGTHFSSFECRHGECTHKFKNLKNFRGHMKKKYNLFWRNQILRGQEQIIAFGIKIFLKKYWRVEEIWRNNYEKFIAKGVGKDKYINKILNYKYFLS